MHWEQFDVDLSIPGMLAGQFGTKAFMTRCQMDTLTQPR